MCNAILAHRTVCASEEVRITMKFVLHFKFLQVGDDGVVLRLHEIDEKWFELKNSFLSL